jgi:hypothetical protein
MAIGIRGNTWRHKQCRNYFSVRCCLTVCDGYVDFRTEKTVFVASELPDSRKGVESRSHKDPLIESHAARSLCFVNPAELGMMLLNTQLEP